jgi:geranylgeranyl pyrophosphate synthase
MRLVVESRFPAERRLKALGALLETHETCVGGQYLDVLPLTRKSFTRARVESIARRKTASYTFVGPLTAGAFLAGAPHSTLQSLSAYGESVGMAYQWIDDLDDVLSLRSGLASNDLDEGKGTAVVLATRRVLSARDRARFDRLLLTVPKTKVAVQELTRYVQAAQVEKLVRAEAAGFAKQGIQSLTQSKALRPEARNRLVELAHYILGFKTE